MYAWICRELVSRIKSPKYLDQGFRDNFGELSGKFLVLCTVGPSSTRTGSWHHPELLHLSPAQRGEKNWDHYRHEPSSAKRMQILRRGLGVTKILLDLPLWTSTPGYSTIFFKIFALILTLHDCWVISAGLCILISNPVPLLYLVWVLWAWGQYWLCFDFKVQKPCLVEQLELLLSIHCLPLQIKVKEKRVPKSCFRPWVKMLWASHTSQQFWQNLIGSPLGSKLLWLQMALIQQNWENVLICRCYVLPTYVLKVSSLHNLLHFSSNWHLL